MSTPRGLRQGPEVIAPGAGFKCRFQASGFRVQGPGNMVEGFGFPPCLGISVQGLNQP